MPNGGEDKLDPSSFGFWLGPRRGGVSVGTPYSVPLSISPQCVLVFRGDASGLVGAEVVREGGPAAAPRHRTHNHSRGFSASAAVCLRTLEPNAVAALAGETGQTRQRRRRQHNDKGQRNKQTDRNRQGHNRQTDPASRSSGGKSASSNGKAKLQHSRGQQQRRRPAAQKRAGTDTPLDVYCTRRQEVIGPSPGSTPAASSLGSPESRVGFRTAPRTILWE